MSQGSAVVALIRVGAHDVVASSALQQDGKFNAKASSRGASSMVGVRCWFEVIMVGGCTCLPMFIKSMVRRLA